MCVFLSQSGKKSVVHRWICLNEKIRPLAVFDGLYYRAGERQQKAS